MLEGSNLSSTSPSGFTFAGQKHTLSDGKQMTKTMCHFYQDVARRTTSSIRDSPYISPRQRLLSVFIIQATLTDPRSVKIKTGINRLAESM